MSDTSALRRFMRRLTRLLPPRARSRLMSLRSRGRARLGPGAYVHRSVQWLGKAHVAVGANSVVSQDGWFNVNHRHGGIAIEIGDHCFIGRRNFFSSGRRIAIGDYVLTANDCQFLGSTHVTDNPMVPVLSTGTTDAAEIVVGVNCFLGAGVRVVGNVRIGHGSVVGAASLVTRSLPPFSQAHGSPAAVHRRYSFPRGQWVALADFDEDDERALPDESSYLQALKKSPPPTMPYIACGSDMGDC